MKGNDGVSAAALIRRQPAMMAGIIKGEAKDPAHLKQTPGDPAQIMPTAVEVLDQPLTLGPWALCIIRSGACCLNPDLPVPDGLDLDMVMPTELPDILAHFAERETDVDLDSAMARFEQVAEFAAAHFETIPADKLGEPVNLWLHGDMTVGEALADAVEHGVLHTGQLRANLRNLANGASPFVALCPGKD